MNIWFFLDAYLVYVFFNNVFKPEIINLKCFHRQLLMSYIYEESLNPYFYFFFII